MHGSFLTVKLPFSITLLGMVGGVFIAILFGVNEDMFKNRIQRGLGQNQKIASIENPGEKAKVINKELSKNWRYYQRYHFHATGIGAMALSILLLLQLLMAPKVLKTLSSYLVSIGGFLYPFIWLFAGMYGPEMGRKEAKEAFVFFGYMGGVFLLGILLTGFLLLRYSIYKESKSAKS